MSCGPCGPTVSGEPAGGGGMGPPGPPGPPGPSGGCANVLIVEAADPFATLPAPVAGVIALPPDTFIKICGDVDIVANILDLPRTSVIGGVDPLVDSVTSTAEATIRMLEGGTVKDLGVRQTGPIGQTIQIGADGQTSQNSVLFNLSISSNGKIGVLIAGGALAVTISRVMFGDSEQSIRVGTTDVLPDSVNFLSIAQVFDQATGGTPHKMLFVPNSTVIGALAVLQCAVQPANAADVGIDIASPNVFTIRVASCAYLFPIGTPSEVSQPGGLPAATVGTAAQSESVGNVGFDNSLQRGSIQIDNAITPLPAPGVFRPIGLPVGPTYTLAANSVRVGLQGATAPAQELVFQRIADYAAEITVDLSVRVATGFTVVARTVAARILLNGAPIGLPFESTVPDFSSGSPTSLSFTTPATLAFNDTVQLEVANMTDAASLLVIAARITIT